jgi:ABC-type polysaccharide/polyol phosphate transport system ATPase subunit
MIGDGWGTNLIPEQALRPGEIKIEGLGKRYWIETGSGGREGDEALDGSESDPDLEAEEGGAASFFRKRTELWALRQIDYHILPGERVAIVGANGSGKSTLIRILSRTLPPSEGRVKGAGIVVPFATLRSPLSLQMSGCDNLRMLAQLLEIPRKRLEERLPHIVEFSELGQLAYEKVSRYSDGSYARLASAMGLLIEPDIFLVDDSLKVGDEAYREKFESKFAEILRGQVTLVYASNALSFLRLYCQRALWLDRGRLVGDGAVKTIIQRFLSKSDETIELEDLARVEDGQSTRTEVLEKETKLTAAGDGGAAPPEASASPTVASVIPAERLKPMQDWLIQSTQAERAWQKVLKRWRDKVHPRDARNIGRVSIDGECTLGVIQTFWCLNSDGRPIRRCLPGEDLTLELVVETFQPAITVAVRLELDAVPTLAWVAEPLVPLVATERGQYLFRAEIDGGFSGHSYENVFLKLRTRVLFEKSGVNRREMVSATVVIDLRGDVRAQFDEQRLAAGEPATTIVQPTPAYVEPPEQIKGFDPAAESSPPKRTPWQNLSRRPALRPSLHWMVYGVVQAPPAEAGEAERTARVASALEPANS